LLLFACFFLVTKRRVLLQSGKVEDKGLALIQEWRCFLTAGLSSYGDKVRYMRRKVRYMRRSFIETKVFTVALFSVAVILGIVGVAGRFHNLWLSGLVLGLGALIKVLVMDL
jgi:lysylphosphatidylglycerol synthetase-like protein (DUF2156 family)